MVRLFDGGRPLGGWEDAVVLRTGRRCRGQPTVFIRGTDGSDAVRLGEGRPLALSHDQQWALAVLDDASTKIALLPTRTGDVRPLPRGPIAEYLDWAAGRPMVAACISPPATHPTSAGPMSRTSMVATRGRSHPTGSSDSCSRPTDGRWPRSIGTVSTTCIGRWPVVSPAVARLRGRRRSAAMERRRTLSICP